MTSGATDGLTDQRTSLVGVVLAAGVGTRLRPLTSRRPKALCPVGDCPLVDHAVDRLAPVTTAAAVNVHHGRRAMEEHLAGRVHLSVEEGGPLGTAGALGHLRGWLDGRPVLVTNVDAWAQPDLAGFVAGWDGERTRLLLAGVDELQPSSGVVAALMPWTEVAVLSSEPAGLYEISWRAAAGAGRLEVVRHDGRFIDCGTPRDYLAANLDWSGGAPVVGAGARVRGTLLRSVVWPGAVVHRGEDLVDAIRLDDRFTVLVR
ncbi:hypothetical protein BH20ACT2_BH20ACT2_06560 [soil metagenome]